MEQKTLLPIIAAVELAAQLTTRIQHDHLMVRHDKKGDPVTIGDYGAQAILGRALHQYFPHDGVVAEESGRQFLTLVTPDQRTEIVKLVGDILGETVTESQMVAWLDQGHGVESERVWMIDPIDGTKGFLSGRRYAIAIGAAVGSRMAAGVMGCPNYPTEDDLGVMFMAADGAAYRRPLWGGTFEPIHVSARTQPQAVLITEGVEDSHVDRAAMHHVYDTLGLSQDAILRVDGMDKYGMVACGDADVYLRIPDDHERRANVWDHAAGVAVLEAAGGKVTDRAGNPLNFSERPILTSTTFVVITNGVLHDQVLAALADIR